MPNSVAKSSLAARIPKTHQDATDITQSAPLRNCNSPAFPLLKLPLELQIKIYCMVLGSDETSGEGIDTEFQLNLRIIAQDAPRSACWGWPRRRHGPSGGITNPVRTSYEITNCRYCYKCRVKRNHQCSDKIRTSYEATTEKISMGLGLGLLAVNRQIRQVTVPLLYGGNCVELFLREGIIPFLEDRGPLARKSIRTLRIHRLMLQPREETVQRLWEVNFGYISQHLVGLRSLVVNILDRAWRDENKLENMNLSIGDMQLQRSNMRWLVALAKLRGLSSLRIKLFTMDHHQPIQSGPAELEAILQEYLESKVFQPRPGEAA